MKVAAAVAVLATVGAVGSCVRAPPPRSFKLAEAPPELAEPVKRADAAIGALQGRLAGRLMEEYERGGPIAAVKVCREVAQPLTGEVSREQGLELGRTSHRLRNPNNAPREWARPHVESAASKKLADAEALVFDLGERVGVLRPIPTGALCVMCHGERSTFSPELAFELEQAYPSDRAVGFAEGDLRGYFWAEVPKAR